MFTSKQQQLIKDKLPQYLKEDADFSVIYHKMRTDFDASKLVAHNWEHIFRDICNAIVIGEAEKADMRIVLPAITMHDIGFLFGANSKTHASIGAQSLRQYIADADVTYSSVELDHIAACIKTHKGSVHDECPETLEAKVVADADILEKLGPLGAYQVVRTFTEFNISLDQILASKYVTDERVLETETGRELAEPQRQFVKDFFRALSSSNAEYPSTDSIKSS